MKKYLLLIICILFTGWVTAQNIKGKYLSRSTEEGTVTYIYPQKGYNSKKLSSKLIYDITHSTATDSVTFNFTYISKDPLPLDSIAFSNENISYNISTTILYIEPKKGNKWENRASAILDAETFKSIRTQESSCNLMIYPRKEEKFKENYIFTISDKDWNRNTGITNKVFDVIKYYK